MTDDVLNRFQLLNAPEMPELRFGALHRMFEYCRQLMASLGTDVAVRQLPERYCIKAVNEGSTPFDRLCESLREEYRIELKSPFEGIATIAGGVWRVPSVLQGQRDDALLKLRFAAGTSRLPMHTHEHSDRIILVMAGTGTYSVSPDSLESFQPTKIRSVPIAAGDLLAFSRGVIHTFETQDEDLLLLSYHSPFVDLEDPRQFTVPSQ